MKGILPVPRDVFARKRGRTTATEEAIAKTTRDPTDESPADPGSLRAWKLKQSAQRKRNLREGLLELKSRKQITTSRLAEQQAAKQRERDELIAMPEHEDERLTAPSHNLDLAALYHGPVPDPSRALRLENKRQRYSTFTAAKKAERLDSLHTLYSHARDFIVTPQQLENAVEDAFGTNENPVTFGGDGGESFSVWAEGKPESVQEMLVKANGGRSDKATQNVGRVLQINKERVKKMAEALTGGKMDDADDRRRHD